MRHGCSRGGSRDSSLGRTQRAPTSGALTVPGGTVGVRMFPTEDGEHVSLSGPAELVYSGALELALDAVTRPLVTAQSLR